MDSIFLSPLFFSIAKGLLDLLCGGVWLVGEKNFLRSALASLSTPQVQKKEKFCQSGVKVPLICLVQIFFGKTYFFSARG